MDKRFPVIWTNAALWFGRVWYDRQGAKVDLISILTFSLWALRQDLLSSITHAITTVAVITAFSTTFLLCRNGFGFGDPRSWRDHVDHDTASNSHALKPLVFPCQTTHTRMFPKKHSFSYSYLFIGVPVGWQGSIGSFLSVDLESSSPKSRRPSPTSKSWFSVEAEDHLSRGADVDGLRGKLEAYLKTQVSH